MLEVSRFDAVSLLTLQRPERRNALNQALCEAIDQTARAEVERGARVLVFTGQGTAFCSGADLTGVYNQAFLDALYGMLHGLTRLPVPLIAAVNGPAIGAGTQLAIACDLRISVETAVYGVPTARNGMAVDAWTMRRIESLATGSLARRLMLAAEMVDAPVALASGLVDRLGNLDAALAWAQEIATLAPLTLAHNKAVLNGADEAAIRQSFDACWQSSDVAEAALARSEKRTPIFTGA